MFKKLLDRIFQRKKQKLDITVVDLVLLAGCIAVFSIITLWTITKSSI